MRSKWILLSWPLFKVACGSITVVGDGRHCCSRQFGHTTSRALSRFRFPKYRHGHVATGVSGPSLRMQPRIALNRFLRIAPQRSEAWRASSGPRLLHQSWPVFPSTSSATSASCSGVTPTGAESVPSLNQSRQLQSYLVVNEVMGCRLTVALYHNYTK